MAVSKSLWSKCDQGKDWASHGGGGEELQGERLMPVVEVGQKVPETLR